MKYRRQDQYIWLRVDTISQPVEQTLDFMR